MKRKVLVTIVVIIVVGVLGVVAMQVGNIGIRRVQSDDAVQLSLSSPLVPGVRTSVHWTVPQGMADRTVELMLRTVEGEQPLGLASLSDEIVSIELPCTVDEETATVTMVGMESGEVLSWIEVELLEPGRDCIQ